MDRFDKQRVSNDVNERECKINETELKRGHQQHLCVSKEVPTSHHYGKKPNQTVSGKSTGWGASLKCIHTNAHGVGNKYEDLQVCVLLQCYDLVGIMETWCDGSHDWSIIMWGYRLTGKNRLERPGEEVALYVREQLECIELCLRMDDEPNESLWVRIKEQTSMGDIVVHVFCK